MSLATLMTEPVRVPPAAPASRQRCGTCPARALSICGAMRSEDLGRLAAARTVQEVAAGTTFLDESEPAGHFFNITHGAVKVYKLLPDGRRQVTGFLFAGDLLGLAVNGAYVYSAEALTPVTICRFPRRQLDRLLDDFPALEKRLLAMASNELAAAQEQMMLLGRKTAHERIASFLLALAGRQARRGGGGDGVRLAMTRTDIADYLGLTTETVSRVFTSLKKRGWIVLGGEGAVRLAAREAIEALAAGLD